MKKVKITILKTTFQEDLAKEYGVDGLSTCPLMKEGEVSHLSICICISSWSK